MKLLLPALFAISTSLCSVTKGADGASTQGQVQAAAFPAEMVIGEVRMVLMSISQTTVFRADPPAKTDHGGKSTVPCFTATFLVERLGSKVTAKGVQRDVTLASATGEPLMRLNERSVYCKSYDYASFPEFLDFAKPKVSDPKRAVIRQYAVFGAAPSQPFDLTIEAGFDEDVAKFTFKSISLGDEGAKSK